MNRQQGTPVSRCFGDSSFCHREYHSRPESGFPTGSSILRREGIDSLKPPDTGPATTVTTPVR